MRESQGRGCQLSAHGVLTNQKLGSIALLVYGLLLVVTELWLVVERLLNSLKEKEFWTELLLFRIKEVFWLSLFLFGSKGVSRVYHPCDVICVYHLLFAFLWSGLHPTSDESPLLSWINMVVRHRSNFDIDFGSLSFSVFKGVSKMVTLKTFNLG